MHRLRRRAGYGTIALTRPTRVALAVFFVAILVSLLAVGLGRGLSPADLAAPPAAAPSPTASPELTPPTTTPPAVPPITEPPTAPQPVAPLPTAAPSVRPSQTAAPPIARQPARAPPAASPTATAPPSADPTPTAPIPAAPNPSPPGPSQQSLSPEALAARVNPSLVHVNAQVRQDLQAAGTGIVLSSSGHVLTNHHVINGATHITVTNVGNGQTYQATVVGSDRAHDIAVLQLPDAADLATAPIGDSDTVEVGDEIAAIGNAGGRGGTPSIAPGRVIALNRTVIVSDPFTGSSRQLTGMIRVAADVEPGDSGGPLVNTTGQVVGIVTAGSTSSRSPPTGGEGFAIPINDAISISNRIRTN